MRSLSSPCAHSLLRKSRPTDGACKHSAVTRSLPGQHPHALSLSHKTSTPGHAGCEKLAAAEVGDPCLWLLQDLAKDRAQHYKKARRFFDGVAAQLTQQQHSLDVFACALDQASRSAPLLATARICPLLCAHVMPAMTFLLRSSGLVVHIWCLHFQPLPCCHPLTCSPT